MRYASIHGKAIGQQDFQVILDFFVEHIFDKFMQSGLEGLRFGIDDMMDNLETFIKVKAPELRNCELTVETRTKTRRYIQMEMINGFIRHGTSALDTTIRNCYQILINMLRDEKCRIDAAINERRTKGQK